MSSPRREHHMQPRRIAMLSVHTSPLDQPGTGDAGGMNVYVVETATPARRARHRGRDLHPRHVRRPARRRSSWPPASSSGTSPPARFEGLAKNDLPGQLCAFTSGVLRVEARHEPGWYDLVHSHYWLSGQVGWLAAERWGVPLVHTMHTMAKVKNAALADGDTPEPLGRGHRRGAGRRRRRPPHREHRRRGARARRPLRRRPGPGRPSSARASTSTSSARDRGGRPCARRRLGLPADGDVLLFVGRIQPLKAPDVLLRAAARLLAATRPTRAADRRRRRRPQRHRPRAAARPWRSSPAQLGIADVVRFGPPVAAARARRLVPRRRPRRRPVAQRVVRAGRPRGAGLRHAGRGRPGRRAADGGGRRRVGRARRRARPAASGPASSPACSTTRCGGGGWARRRRRGRRRFGWDATVDALLDVYAGAIADRPLRAVAARRPRVPLPAGDLAVAP